MKTLGYSIDPCGDRKFVCFSKETAKLRLEVYIMLNEDSYEEWYKNKSTKAYKQQLDQLALSHPHIVKDNQNVGCKMRSRQSSRR